MKLRKTWALFQRRRQAAREASQAFQPGGPPAILVYQMGKVGSQTVVHSLQAAQLPNAVLHLHFISTDIAAHRKTHLDAGMGTPPYSLDLGDAVRAQLGRPRAPRCKVITLVRDPIAFQVSNLFQNPQFANSDVRSEDGQFDGLKVTRYLEELLHAPNAFDYVYNWFDRELKRVFAIDVFAQPFPKQQGWDVLAGRNADALIMRMEDLSAAGPAAMGDFLGLPAPLAMTPANVRAESRDSAAYRQVLENLRLGPELCARVYASRLVAHFYTDQQVAAFVRRWSGS